MSENEVAPRIYVSVPDMIRLIREGFVTIRLQGGTKVQVQIECDDHFRRGTVVALSDDPRFESGKKIDVVLA